MSMFRRPGEDSSSSSEASLDTTEEDETSASHHDSILSRIQTLESAVAEQPSDRQVRSRPDFRQNSTQNVRDLMLHALLEEKAINEAAQHLGKDVSDPEVQRHGREAYQNLARQLSSNVDESYSKEELRSHRATAQAGISKLTKDNLSRLVAVPNASTSQALVSRPVNNVTMEIPQQPTPNFDILSGMTVPAELHLRGYPGLQTDRYDREFSELDIVGKGGYGKVFKARHKLDGSLYAVKRIPVSPAKLAKMQEHGSLELENMLEEVRSLARFDHNNIVRYHNAWLEFTTPPAEVSVPTMVPFAPTNRLIENASSLSTSTASTNGLHKALGNVSLSGPLERLEDTYSDGIIFETSDTGPGPDDHKSEAENLSLNAQLRRSSRNRLRRDSQASQATIATISSTKSRMSAVEDVDEEDEDDDIENIPRSHMPYSQEAVTELTESMVSHSDVPGHLVPLRSSGPILTLNVQMSLCETSLAAFLSAERGATGSNPMDRHCFHPCVSLELLHHIVSGVDYLHSKGVVHRDMKPANVFLSLSTDRHPPYGSVDLSSCKSCPQRDRLHVTPRIGDFGLVAALSDECKGFDAFTKPVGTEFYRPESNSRVSEKLDVFALGVVGFEMLHKFETRMERVAALADLRRGKLPEAFSPCLGGIGDKVHQLISDMVHADERERLSCEVVKHEIAQLVHILKD